MVGWRAPVVSVTRPPPARAGTNFAETKPKDDERLSWCAAIWRQERRDRMDYLVVFATMLMIAGYACIIGRSLRKLEP